MEPDSDQDEETEQSLSDSLHTRRQIARIHENMGHPSNRTVVRVLRLGGAKRRFVLAAAKNTVVVRVKHSYEKHILPAMNIVCWGAGFQRVVLPSRPVGRNFDDRVQKHNWLRSNGKRRILVVDQQRNLCTGTFAEK